MVYLQAGEVEVHEGFGEEVAEAQEIVFSDG